ncbi:MAG TPA: replicative DNA helicase [Firmicutes bacterium]|jgi:replicative DNA helicase|nr:replicative DNA helicase [Bacillota bacterium]HHT43808.1 replicative DNA helicase [Bacillota bacterium]
MSLIDVQGTELPMDLTAERQVLGILIKHPTQVDRVIDRLRPSHFVDLAHRRIYEIILELYHKQGRISYTQVYNRLLNESIESPAELLIALTESFVSVTELEPCVEILRRSEGVRRLVKACESIKTLAMDPKAEDLADIQAQAQEIIFNATQGDGGPENEIKNLLEVLSTCYMNLLNRKEGLEDAYGLSVRFPSIDGMTTGFKKKDLIILAARPSMGKTALLLNMVTNVAKRDIPVLFFSLEMDAEQLGDRIVLSELFTYKQEGRQVVTSHEYQTKLSDEQFQVTQQAFNDLYDLPISIVDKRGLTVAEIRAKARRFKAENPNLGLIVIDYLQLIKPPAQSNRSWALIVGEIVRELRDLAGELDVPLILCSQLNRGVESRDNKRPMMSDLRDSGNIEEFADVVMFLYRDDYYNPDLAKEKGTEGIAEVIFAKQRKGATGVVYLRFIREYTRFIEETRRPVEVNHGS